MLDSILKMMPILTANFNDILVNGLIMVSVISVAIGLLKPILFNKITNKQVRKVALAFTNLALCFISVFVIFLVKGWNFEYYLTASIAILVISIVTYWFYENTCLRNLIGTIGNIALKKLANIATIAINTDDINEIKTEAKKVADELRTQAKTELKKATNEIKEDNDLKGL